MKNARSFSNRWFGFWREEGAGFNECPRLSEWIEPNWTTHDSLVGTARYLDGAPDVWATSAEPCLLCRERLGVSLTYRTDGLWYWPSTLSHYVLQHCIRLPDELYARILEAQFVPPKHLWEDGDEQGFVRLLRSLDVPPPHMSAIESFAKQHHR